MPITDGLETHYGLCIKGLIIEKRSKLLLVFTIVKYYFR